MSVMWFSQNVQDYSATFELEKDGQKSIIHLGVWTDLKQVQKYITTTLNCQRRYIDNNREQKLPNGKYIRSVNDACYIVMYQGFTITAAWASPISHGDPVEGSRREFSV